MGGGVPPSLGGIVGIGATVGAPLVIGVPGAVGLVKNWLRATVEPPPTGVATAPETETFWLLS